MLNEILLRRKQKLTIERGMTTDLETGERAMILSMMKNIEALGFTFSEDIVSVLLTFSKEEIIGFYSDGDISLAKNTRYKSPRRCERRMIMNLLSFCKNPLEDMYRHKERWIRVGEVLHPCEFYSKRYTEVRRCFSVLRNEKKPLFTSGIIQEAIKRGDIREAVTQLMYRPGDFARQLDKLLRDSDDHNYIINSFNRVANKVSTPVLLQVRQHFLDRNNGNPIRVFFPKGKIAKAISIRNDLPEISRETCNQIVKICDSAIVDNLATKAPMGTVYVDEGFENYLVPFNQRSSSSSNKCLIRGSKVNLSEDASVVRAFIWWTNSECQRVDIDLSAALYDENWSYVEHVSYTNLRSEKVRAYHSGDIVNGGDPDREGVAEFLDIDIASMKTKGRYVAFQIYSYTEQRFSELPNCRFGWMERDSINSGEIFEPSTVEINMDITAESTTAIPVIFDCVERTFIWCDLNLSIDQMRNSYGGNNLESNIKGVTAACYAMTRLSKPNLYTLITLNAIARGRITKNRNLADIIFSNDKTAPYEIESIYDEETQQNKMVRTEKKDIPIITAFDVDYFMGKLL